ncbi:hypothetical protein [Mycobacterium sp. SMC-4]
MTGTAARGCAPAEQIAAEFDKLMVATQEAEIERMGQLQKELP